MLSPVHTSNNVEATLSKQQATLLPVASTMLPFLATVSKQRSTLSKGRNFNAKLVRHCCRFCQQSRTLLRHCCWCGPGFKKTELGTDYTFRHSGLPYSIPTFTDISKPTLSDNLNLRPAAPLHPRPFSHIIIIIIIIIIYVLLRSNGRSSR